MLNHLYNALALRYIAAKFSHTCHLNVTTLTDIKSIPWKVATPMFAIECRRPDRRPSKGPRVIFSARDRRRVFCERREKRAKRVKASFVTMRDISGKTSGRKQLDDLSTPVLDYDDEWFYRHLLQKSARPKRDTRQMVRTRKIESYIF